MPSAAPCEALSVVGPGPALRDGSRDALIAYADRLLAGVAPWASPNFARITLPGAVGGYGHDVDGLEGFARTFLLAGFRIAGARGNGVDKLIDDYSRGIAAGVDPEAEDRWVRLDEHAQAKVEAASIALVLDMTRPWIWDRLDGKTKARVIDYFAPAVGDDTYPQTNWVWFRLVVQTFLRSVGGPWSSDDVASDLARHDSFVRSGGWLSDGDERSYDHYVGWALHVYPVLWSRMQGAADLANGRTDADIAALDRYLQDAVHLIGADGSPLIQGRSLIYRFAAAAPFWVGAIANVPSIPLGQLRHAAGMIVNHFAERDVPDGRDLLTMGWHHEWRTLAQSYSGPGSPYWAVKGLLGIALPEDHPVWSAPAVPLPVEVQDDIRSIGAPGWIVSSTVADGLVRVINHGTDHAHEGDLVGDAPLYARIGYSTATSPLLDSDAWQQPLDQSVVVLDAQGRAAHRSGMTLLGAGVTDGVGVAGSTATPHWINPSENQKGHGSGIAGEATTAGQLTTWSIVRRDWEVRITRLERLALGIEAVSVRVGGWPVTAGEPRAGVSEVSAYAASGKLTSAVYALTDGAVADVVVRSDATPLGPVTAVPTLEFPCTVGGWIAVGVQLTGNQPEEPPALDLDENHYTITWPDGKQTSGHIPDSRALAGTKWVPAKEPDAIAKEQQIK